MFVHILKNENIQINRENTLKQLRIHLDLADKIFL